MHDVQSFFFGARFSTNRLNSFITGMPLNARCAIKCLRIAYFYTFVFHVDGGAGFEEVVVKILLVPMIVILPNAVLAIRINACEEQAHVLDARHLDTILRFHSASPDLSKTANIILYVLPEHAAAYRQDSEQYSRRSDIPRGDSLILLFCVHCRVQGVGSTTTKRAQILRQRQKGVRLRRNNRRRRTAEFVQPRHQSVGRAGRPAFAVERAKVPGQTTCSGRQWSCLHQLAIQSVLAMSTLRTDVRRLDWQRL